MERMMPNMITEAMALHASRTFGHFLLNAIKDRSEEGIHQPPEMVCSL